MDEDIGALQDRSFASASAATVKAYPPERRLTTAQLARYLDPCPWTSALPGLAPCLD
jgi:hypothetical protein